MNLRQLRKQLEDTAERIGWEAPVTAWLLTMPDAPALQPLATIGVTGVFAGSTGKELKIPTAVLKLETAP